VNGGDSRGKKEGKRKSKTCVCTIGPANKKRGQVPQDRSLKVDFATFTKDERRETWQKNKQRKGKVQQVTLKILRGGWEERSKGGPGKENGLGPHKKKAKAKKKRGKVIDQTARRGNDWRTKN